MAYPVLTKLGLTKKEADVYETLLRLGDTPIADAIRATGNHPQIVYRAVDGLIKKNLATTTRRNNRLYARAESPRILEKLEAEKLEELRRSLPQLLSIEQLSKDAIIRVARGNDAVYHLRKRGIGELTKGHTYYIIGASGNRFYEIMGERYSSIERERIKKGIKKRLIAFKNQRDSLRKHDPWRALAEFRFLPQAFAVPSSTNIFKNTIAILIWSYDPIVITIESKEVAESYRHYFGALWKNAQK